MHAKITRGSLTLLKAGQWRWQPFVNGRRISRYFAGPRGKREAWRYVEDVLRPKELAGLGQEPDRWTLSRYLAEWLVVKAAALPARRTRVLYEEAARHFGRQPLGAILLRELSSRQVEQWVNVALVTHAPSTVATYLTILKQALQWGVDAEPPLLLRNPARKVKRPTDDRPSRKPYTLAEMQALIAALKPPYGAGIALGLLGLRIGEVLAVHRRDDLDYDAATIHVRHKIVRPDGGAAYLEPPKRGRTRTVPMPAWAVPILKEQAEYSLQERSQTGLLLVRIGAPDKPLYPERLRLALYALCDEVGVRRLSFHGLRHTFATVMRHAGASDLDIAAAMGHASTKELVMRYGNHPDQDAPRNARLAGVLERLVTSDEQAAQ